MSKNQHLQAINGLLLINKPLGMSSNACLQQVKRLYQAKKAGHTGSLDPLATGMLPICFGEATKFSQYLLDADKIYEAEGLLGIKTSTADAAGEVTHEVSSFEITETDLLQTMATFKGVTQQIPSMFSALKHQGTPLYKLARAGKSVERKAREISIEQLDLLFFNGKSFVIKVHCSKGTYIRNLVEDIGESLAVGAHVTRLHRISTGGFGTEPMYSLEELMEKSPAERLDCLLPMEALIKHLPSMQLNAAEVLSLRQGKVLSKFASPVTEGCFRLYDEENQLIGLGLLDQLGSLAVKRLLAI